jgi:type I restriction enzyme S subunit
VRDSEIPLPPLREQRRLAEILDEADCIRQRRRAATMQLELLSSSIFESLFGDPVTNPLGWATDRLLGQVAEIVSGVTKGRRLKGQTTRLVPYLAVANVQDGHLNLGNLKTIEATPAEIERFRLSPGDLLLTEGGDPDKLGRGALWSGEISEAIHQNHVFRVRLKDLAIMDPVFLNAVVSSQRGKLYFLQAAKQTTGIASINAGQLKNFPLLVPPIDLQRQFAQAVGRLELLRGKLVQHAEALDTLFASLQYRAFAGKL